MFQGHQQKEAGLGANSRWTAAPALPRNWQVIIKAGCPQTSQVSSILSWPLAKLQNTVVGAQPPPRKRKLENHKNTKQKERTGHRARLSRKQWWKAARPSAQASWAL